MNSSLVKNGFGVQSLTPSAKKTLVNTFGTVGIMQLIAAATCWTTMGVIPPMSIVGSLVGFVVMTLLVMGIHMAKNSALGVVLLGVFAAFSGAIVSPLIGAYLSSPELTSVLYQALGLTAAASFGASAYAIISRRDFSFMGAFLFAGLLVLIVAGLLNLFITSSALSMVIGVVGSILFLLYLLLDVSRIVNGHETNYVSASISVYLDIFNLFLSILRVLSPRN